VVEELSPYTVTVNVLDLDFSLDHRAGHRSVFDSDILAAGDGPQMLVRHEEPYAAERNIIQIYRAFSTVLEDSYGFAAGALPRVMAIIQGAERRHAAVAAHRFFSDPWRNGDVSFFFASGAGDAYPAVFDITGLGFTAHRVLSSVSKGEKVRSQYILRPGICQWWVQPIRKKRAGRTPCPSLAVDISMAAIFPKNAGPSR
jgi:hypothetical protein